VTLNKDKYQKSVPLKFRYYLGLGVVSPMITCILAEIRL